MLENGHSSRVADFFEIKPIPSRTAAQREAARRNGSKSRGPVSSQGKSKSRLNALKHGLLVRVLAPPDDVRGQSCLFLRIREALIKDFRPTGFSTSAAIDVLATDYVQLARVRQMIEEIQRPAPLASADREKLKMLKVVRRDLRAIRRLLKRLDGARAPACNEKQSLRLAGEFVKFLTETKTYVADLERAANSGASTNSFDQDELDRAKALLQAVGSTYERFTQVLHLSTLLQWRRPPDANERRSLRALLTWFSECKEIYLTQSRLFEVEIDSMKRQLIGSLARSPGELILLYRYQAKLERSIERKLDRLGRR